MTSAAATRPSEAMTGAARSARFGDYNSATMRPKSDDRSSQSSTLGQTFGNGGSWQTSGTIWSNPIGTGFSSSSTKREASRSRGTLPRREPGSAEADYNIVVNNDLSGPSGSGALADTSEADPSWGIRQQNGPWNADTTSPTLTSSHSGSTSPIAVRGNTLPSDPRSLLEIQHSFPQSRPAIGQGSSYARPQTKSSLDPSSGPFKFDKQSSFNGYIEDKENSIPPFLSNTDYHQLEVPSRSYRADQTVSQNTSFRGIGSSASRDGSMPPSRASDSGFSTKSLGFGQGSQPYGSIGGHTPNSPIHSQRPSGSRPSGSHHSQTNGSRYIDRDTDLRDQFGRIKFEADGESPGMGSQLQQIVQYQSSDPTQQPYQLNGGAGMWDNYPNGQKSLARQDNYQPFQDQYYKQPPQFGDRGSVSPAGSDYRRGPNSPSFYPGAGTPPSGFDQGYRPGSRGPRVQQGPNELERRLQTIHFAQQFYATYGQLPNQYPQHMYDYSTQNFRPANLPYGLQMPMLPYGAQIIPTRPAKDQDIGAGIRSELLEEFRSNSKTNKRYELKDLYDHVVEFSGDQHGSRFIQQKLETANSDEKEQIFREIQPNAVQLMTDVFGNYVIQKMFEHGNQIQKKVLAEQMRHHVMDLSLQMYGCRVVQKALEHVLADQQVELVSELETDVLRCVKDQNGNHVVQKAIERVPTEHLKFVIEAFRGQVSVLATHPYGCRVIQRILEHCKHKDQVGILEELHVCSEMLVTDQFGNYVTQHVIQHGQPIDRAKVIKIVTSRLFDLSKHKFASNVVEKSIQFGTDEQRAAIVAQLTSTNVDGTSILQLMMKDQYGNYVIQKLLAQLKGAERDSFVEAMKPQLISLKKYNYGKQIAAIEKLIFVGPHGYIGHPLTMNTTNQTHPMENSPTPMLTNGQNSPQSSSVPSTSVSTTEESIESTASENGTIAVNEKSCPEVVINGV